MSSTGSSHLFDEDNGTSSAAPTTPTRAPLPPASMLFRGGVGFSERPGSMPLLVEAEGAPAQNCHRLVVLGSSKVGKTAIVNRFLNNRFDDKYTPTIEDFHRKVYRIRGEAYRLDILDTSGNNPFPAMKRLSLLTGDLFILVYSIDNHESFEEIGRLINEIFEIKGHAHHTHNHLHHFRHQHGSTQSISSLVSVSGNSGSSQGGGSPVTAGVVIGSSSGPVGSSRSSVLSRSSSKHSPPIVIVGNKSDREGSRVVETSELTRLVESVSQCVGVETSAKKNVNIEEVFVALFVLARLPTEMSPSLHRRVPPTYVGGSAGAGNGTVGKDCSDLGSSSSSKHGQSPLSKFGFIANWRSKKSGDSAVRRAASGSGGGGGGSLLTRRRMSDACGAVAPNVRRPSIRTDLLLLQTRRSRTGGLFGNSGSSSVGSLGLSLGLGTAAAVAGVCAGVGASSKKNEASNNATAEDSGSDDCCDGRGSGVIAGRVIGSSDVIGSSSKCVVQ